MTQYRQLAPRITKYHICDRHGLGSNKMPPKYICTRTETRRLCKPQKGSDTLLLTNQRESHLIKPAAFLILFYYFHLLLKYNVHPHEASLTEKDTYRMTPLTCSVQKAKTKMNEQIRSNKIKHTDTENRAEVTKGTWARDQTGKGDQLYGDGRKLKFRR